MPIGQGVVIDRRRILELVDQMRSSVPWEVRDARDIVNEKEAILEEARREADGIIARAENEAVDRLQENALAQQAERQAQQIIDRAEQRAQGLMDQAHEQVQARLRQAEYAANNQMDEADRYALEMLRRLEHQLTAFGATIHNGIEALEERTGQGAQQQSIPYNPDAEE